MSWTLVVVREMLGRAHQSFLESQWFKVCLSQRTSQHVVIHCAVSVRQSCLNLRHSKYLLTLELQRFVRGNVAHELAFDSMSRVFVTSVVVLRVQVC
jgi:hypothetical protein